MYTNAFENYTYGLEHYPELYDKGQIIRDLKKWYGPDAFRYKSPIGHIDIIARQPSQYDLHLTHLFFNDDTTFYEPPTTPGNQVLQQTKEMLDRYFSGKPVDFREIPVKIDWGTYFQDWVWEAIREIPHGEVRSYKWIANKIGRPKSYRAVGNATGKNPISIVIPCHRVIGSNRSLGGYGGGIERKKILLSIEKYPIKTLKQPKKGA